MGISHLPSATVLLLPSAACAPELGLRVYRHRANSSTLCLPKAPLLPLTSPFNAHREAEPGAASLRRSLQGGFPFSPAPFTSPAHSVGWERNLEHRPWLMGSPGQPVPPQQELP